MKIPFSLIQSFLPSINLPAQKIGDLLTLLGIEVDRIENETPSFSGVVVGEVKEVQKHPHAESLVIAKVSDGKDTFQVVCGDPKCRKNMKTAFAKVGAILTDADGKQRRIEQTEIRGAPSFGMLCSSEELTLSKEADQILDLPPEMKPGEDLAKLLWDPVFELSLTPNLGHVMSGLGIARELAASLNLKVEVDEIISEKKSISKKVIVRDLSLCPRYMCAEIEGIEVGPSPFWLKKQLEASGQRSINNVVDVTNYIMLKLGQPLHAFDLNLLKENSLVVEPAEEQTLFTSLDGEERTVPKGALLIKNGEIPIAIAGIIGGQNSAVTEKTKRVLIEAASFEPVSVRTTARKMGLRTESSQRFEKGVDPMGVEAALLEAATLLGGKLVGYHDIQKESLEPKEIRYRKDRINQILGTKLSQNEIMDIFKRLGFKPGKDSAKVPLYRFDIEQEIDLIEEVARVYGYNHIEKKAPLTKISEALSDPMFFFENKIRNILAASGLIECLNCDLIGPKLHEVSKKIAPHSIHFLKARYAKTEEYSILRASLLPGLLETVKNNIAKKNPDLSIFEIGRVHFLQKDSAVEVPTAAILLTGRKAPSHWSQKKEPVDFFDLKAILENLIEARYVPSKHIAFHPKRQADLYVDGVAVGSIGELHPTLLSSFDIKEKVYYAEINLTYLLQKEKKELKALPLSQFPASERDLTVSISKHFEIATLFEEIKMHASPLLESAELIDLYSPELTDKKNATIRFTYRDTYKTVSFEEVESAHKEIVETITKLLAK